MTIQEAAAKKVLIAAHRGVAGGNVPCNSIPAFQAALRQGADIIELDITKSRDGVLYVFHPGKEPVFLRSETEICDLDSRQVDAMRLHNQDLSPTQYPVPRLREVLELLRGKCYINLDKFWSYPMEIAREVRELNMQDQVLVKTMNYAENFARVEEVASDLPYMVVAWDEDDFTEELLRRNMRYVGVEALFASEDKPICQEQYVKGMADRGMVMWANSIVYDYNTVLTAGHTDDIAVSTDPDYGWGWLLDRGFNIIQTDWPMALKDYLGR